MNHFVRFARLMMIQERKFHPNTGESMCTNSFDYPPLWDNPELKDQYFFETLEECCEAIFNTPTCSHEDICTPTSMPSVSPSGHPTKAPTNSPTNAPTNGPTNEPTNAPTNGPTNEPTNAPTNGPTNEPTSAPTNVPTNAPTNAPTPPEIPPPEPTANPTYEPTMNPTDEPTYEPTVNPTPAPTFGATPTVSKEVTGPPTYPNVRGKRSISRPAFVKDVSTECREVVGGNPPVCVYVCTEFTTMSDGRETAKTTESHCPE